MDYPPFPDFSDLRDVGHETLKSWETEWATRELYRRYYTGEVFNETITAADGSGEALEKYPIGLNLVKMLCLAQADSHWGEWDEAIVRFDPAQDAPINGDTERAVQLAQDILRQSGANTVLWEIGLDREIYGGGVLKVSPDNAGKTVRWTRVQLPHFFPVWDPQDIDSLLECYLVYTITKEQALQRYGYRTSLDALRWVEHWTRFEYESTLDGKRIDEFSGRNPWGIIPLVFIPRFRSAHWWGESLTADLLRPQDELNIRIADLGEGINYNSHPVRWGKNLGKAFNTDSFPLAPNVLWDLGKALTKDAPEPEVGILEARAPIPPEAFTYLNFVYDWARTSSFDPPVAFGEDSDGSQRSGATLEIRMWPLIKATRRSRAYMAEGLRRALSLSARILGQKQYPGLPSRALSLLPQLVPNFAPILPRDQAAIVDEVTKDLANTPPSISLVTAVKKLGYGTSEIERIEAMIASPMYRQLQAFAHPKPDPKGPDSATGAAPERRGA